MYDLHAKRQIDYEFKNQKAKHNDKQRWYNDGINETEPMSTDRKSFKCDMWDNCCRKGHLFTKRSPSQTWEAGYTTYEA